MAPGSLDAAVYLKKLLDYFFGRTVLSGATTISGQITVATAGVAVKGSNNDSPTGFFIKALAANTGKIYVGNDGAGNVNSANGFELAAGDLIMIQVPNLGDLYFNATVGGEKVCWIKV